MKYIIFYSMLLYSFLSFSKTVVFLGDSLTAGYGIEPNKAYPKLIEAKLLVDKISEIKIVNGSVSGSTSASAYKRLQFYLKMKPDILVLALGANDGLRGIDPNVTEANLKRAIKLAIDNNISVLLCGVRVPPNYGKDYHENFIKIYSNLKKEFDLKFIPRILEDVAGKPELNLEDGIHPNEKGHEIIANTVYSKLKEML